MGSGFRKGSAGPIVLNCTRLLTRRRQDRADSPTCVRPARLRRLTRLCGTRAIRIRYPITRTAALRR
jgi:hypothetical protein